MNIAIYVGKGTSQKGARELQEVIENHAIQGRKPIGKVTYVTEKEIQTGGLKKADILIITGGRGAPLKEGLGEKGMQTVLEYVREGGKYLGICSGGYVGAKEIIFKNKEKEDEEVTEVRNNNNFGFFKGVAKGPIQEPTRNQCFSPNDFKSIAIARLKFANGLTTSVLYHAGPEFVPDPTEYQEYEVLGEYMIGDQRKKAVIKTKFGKGEVILMSAHPYSTRGVDPQHFTDPTTRQEAMTYTRELEACKQERLQSFFYLLDQLTGGKSA